MFARIQFVLALAAMQVSDVLPTCCQIYLRGGDSREALLLISFVLSARCMKFQTEWFS